MKKLDESQYRGGEGVRADEIKHALSRRHVEDFFCTEVKNGPSYGGGLLIMDAFAMKKSWANPCLSGYEIKVSRSDFSKDNKWPGYLHYCNQFSFVCPTGLIDIDELPDEVGLIYYNHEKKSLYTKRKAKHRIIDVPVELYIYLIMTRLDSNRHPFFEDKREYFEAYVQDKEKLKHLSCWVNSKLVQSAAEMEKETESLRRQLEQQKKDVEFLETIKKILNEHGIRTGMWNDWEDELIRRLKTGIPSEATAAISSLAHDVRRLEKLLGE